MYDEDGVRFRIDRGNNDATLYGVFRKWAKKNGVQHGFSSWRQVCAEIYDDVVTIEDMRRRWPSLRNWKRDLERIGALRIRERVSKSGQSLGIEWWILDPMSPDSSDGSSYPPTTTIRVVRRRESREEATERNVKPYSRRGGRAGVRRYERRRPSREPESLFSSSISSEPLASCTPFGRTGSKKAVAGARAVGHRQRGIDTNDASGHESVDHGRAGLPPWPSAALDTLRTTAESGGGLESLRQAAANGAPVDAVAIVAFELTFRRSARLSHLRRRQLLGACGQLDRCANYGAGESGYAIQRLLDMIEGAGRYRTKERPKSLAFFVVHLRRQGRQWKRHQRERRSA